MARAPLRNTDMRMEYVNVPKTPSRRSPPVSANDKLLRLLLLSFGLLCILQAVLNVSLRIFLYSSDTKPTTFKGSCNNLTDQTEPNNLDQYFCNGWMHFGASLYYISTAKKSWQDSRDYCLRSGADLIVINSIEEQEFTRKFHRFMWIGLRNTTYGTWIWVDGTPLTTSYWGPGEPNMRVDEECVETRFFEVRDTWNDLTCEDLNSWICEKKVAL